MPDQQIQRSPEDIESEIDETRTQMDATIDALQERLSVRRIGQQARRAVQRKMPQPPSGGRRFYTKRPMLVSGIAFGVGLSAGFLLSPPETEPRMRGSRGTRRRGTLRRRTQTAMRRTRSKARGVKDRTMEKVGTLRDRASTTADAVREETKEVMDEAREASRRIKETTKEGSGRVVDEAKHSVKDVQKKTT